MAAIAYEVEPLDAAVNVVVQSELVANEELPLLQGDPRTGATLPAPLLERADAARRARGGLVHATRHTGQCIAAVMDHVVDGPSSTEVQSESFPHLARTTVMVALEPGQRLRLVKFVAYSWSGSRSPAAVRDQADAALGQAARTGWHALAGEQRAYLDDLWARADVELDGDAEVQQAVRFGLFHVLQAGARAEGRAIPAKGLTGPGYNGHAFWDTETLVLPVLTYTVPEAAAQALRWRQTTLPMARDRAAQLGLAGAAFPWRTIAGAECSSYWPAAPPRSTSAPTSPTPSSGTSAPPATTRSSLLSAWNCSPRPRACGTRWVITTRRDGSVSTASPARKNTARSRTTTSTRT